LHELALAVTHDISDKTAHPDVVRGSSKEDDVSENCVTFAGW